jgi:hypothetical protein
MSDKPTELSPVSLYVVAEDTSTVTVLTIIMRNCGSKVVDVVVVEVDVVVVGSVVVVVQRVAVGVRHGSVLPETVIVKLEGPKVVTVPVSVVTVPVSTSLLAAPGTCPLPEPRP